MSKVWEGGSTTRWRKIRANILLQNKITNGGRCTLSTPVCTGIADTVHHTLGRAITGDDPRYLVAACAACNGHLGQPNHRPDPPCKPRTKWD